MIMNTNKQIKNIDNSHGFHFDHELEAICKSFFTGDDHYEGFYDTFISLSWVVGEIIEDGIYFSLLEHLDNYEY